MSGTAPYEVTVQKSDDETFAFMLSLGMADGTDFPFDEYEHEYSLTRDGCSVLALTVGNGITIDAPSIAFENTQGNGTLRRGSYQHGYRIRHLATGTSFQIFVGPVKIGEGNF